MSRLTEACSETTWDGWHSHPCRRPVKRNGMCGPHAAGKERSAKADADRKAKSAEARRKDLERKERQAALVEAAAAVERVTEIVARWEQEAAMRGPDDTLLTVGAAAMLRAALEPAAAMTAEPEASVSEVSASDEETARG